MSDNELSDSNGSVPTGEETHVLVSVRLKIPIELEHGISKTTIRRKDVELMWADWPNARYIKQNTED